MERITHSIPLILSIACVVLATYSSLLAQEHENIDQISRIYDCWDRATDIEVVGDFAYVATGYSGLQIVDISDPESLNVVGYWDENSHASYNVAVSGNYAYITGYKGGISVISISDPEHPREVGNWSQNAGAIAISGEYALVESYELSVLSLANPEQPEEVGVLEKEYPVNDICVSGGLFYVAEGSSGLRIISIADPTQPEEIGCFETRGSAEGVAVSDEYAYLVYMSDDFIVLSIADPTHPEAVGSCNIHGTEVAIYGDFAYIANSTFGIHIVSIENPFNPEEVGLYSDNATAIEVKGDYAYVASISDGMYVLSVADPVNIKKSGIYDSEYLSMLVKVAGDYVLVRRGMGIAVFSFENPESPQEVGWIETDEFVMDFAVSGEYVYAVMFHGGINIYSIAEPEHPQFVKYLETKNICISIEISGQYAYLLNLRAGFQVFSIKDPEHLVELGSLRLEWMKNRLIVKGDFAYAGYDQGEILVISVANHRIPKIVNQLPKWAAGFDFDIANGFVYVADGNFGLKIMSVMDPLNPKRMGCFNRDCFARSVTVSRGYAFVSDDRGLQIISVADPEHPEKVGYYHTPGYPEDIEVSEGGIIFVSDYTNLGLYRFNSLALKDKDTLIPTQVTLWPAYPNPFNSSTTITYGLPQFSKMSLQLYNQSGQLISTLDDGIKIAGVYDYILNAGDLPSGLYFARLNADRKDFTQKIMLIK